MKTAMSVAGVLALLVIASEPTLAQQDKKEASFKWVNASSSWQPTSPLT